MGVGNNVQLTCRRRMERKRMKKLLKMQKTAYASRKKVEDVVVDKCTGCITKSSKKRRRKELYMGNGTSAPEKRRKNFEKNHRRKFELVKAIREDEAEIKALSKKLGYDKRKSKNLPRVFCAEGLDYILEMCDVKKHSKTTKSGVEAESQVTSNISISENGADEIECSSDEEDYEGDSEGVKYRSEKKRTITDETIEEDIYGRIIGQESDKTVPSVYGAHRKLEELSRKLTIENDESNVRLERSVRGILNRLSEKTIVDSIRSLRDIFSKHSHNEVKQLLYESIYSAIAVEYRLPDRIVIEIAVFIALLHSTISNDLSSYFVERFTLAYLRAIKEENEGKALENMTALISHLYNFKVIKDSFVTDLMGRLMEVVDEKNMECAKLLLTYTGPLLKKRNFSVLLKCVVNAQNVIYSLPEERLRNQHLRFINEEFLDIKKGNIRKWTDTVDFSLFEHYFSLYQGITKRSEKVDELGMSVVDIEHVDHRGRWWLIGSAWNPAFDGAENSKEPIPIYNKRPFNSALMELAKKANMNTPVRKEIFCTLLSSEDESGAFENLLRLSLKGQQEKEIIHICLHCALQETVYNPFYSAVIERFCLYHKRFKLTTQYGLWDRLKNLSNLKKWQRRHLATITAELIIKRSVSLTVLKVVEFSNIDSLQTQFLRCTIETILIRCSNSLLLDICGKIVRSPAQKDFSQGLQIFIHMTMKDTENEMVLSKIEFLDSIWGDSSL